MMAGVVGLSCCCPALWFPAYAGMTGRGGWIVLLLPRPVVSRLRGNDGPGLVGLDLLLPRIPCTSGLRIKSAMTGRRPVDALLREGK